MLGAERSPIKWGYRKRKRLRSFLVDTHTHWYLLVRTFPASGSKKVETIGTRASGVAMPGKGRAERKNIKNQAEHHNSTVATPFQICKSDSRRILISFHSR